MWATKQPRFPLFLLRVTVLTIHFAFSIRSVMAGAGSLSFPFSCSVILSRSWSSFDFALSTSAATVRFFHLNFTSLFLSQYRSFLFPFSFFFFSFFLFCFAVLSLLFVLLSLITYRYLKEWQDIMCEGEGCKPTVIKFSEVTDDEFRLLTMELNGHDRWSESPLELNILSYLAKGNCWCGNSTADNVSSSFVSSLFIPCFSFPPLEASIFPSLCFLPPLFLFSMFLLLLSWRLCRLFPIANCSTSWFSFFRWRRIRPGMRSRQGLGYVHYSPSSSSSGPRHIMWICHACPFHPLSLLPSSTWHPFFCSRSAKECMTLQSNVDHGTYLASQFNASQFRKITRGGFAPLHCKLLTQSSQKDMTKGNISSEEATSQKKEHIHAVKRRIYGGVSKHREVRIDIEQSHAESRRREEQSRSLFVCLWADCQRGIFALDSDSFIYEFTGEGEEGSTIKKESSDIQVWALQCSLHRQEEKDNSWSMP